MKKDLEIYMVSKYFRLFYKDLVNMIPYSAGTEEMQAEIESKLEQYFTPDWKKWTEDKKKRFLLWGSPALKAYVIRYDIASCSISGELLQRYNFSSLISAMQEKNRNYTLRYRNNTISNRYRKSMIEKEIDNNFLHSSLQNIDIIMIDFLEERYDIVEYQGNYYTKSPEFDLLEYTKNKDCKILKRNSSEVDELWKESCSKFIGILKKNFEPENVYLIKRTVHSNMRDYDCSCNQKEMNEILEEYYDYFLENFTGINYIL